VKIAEKITVDDNDKKIREYIQRAPAPIQKRLEKVLIGKAGRAAVLKMKCHECMAFENAVSRIRDCSIVICPLHPYRPYQMTQTEKRKHRKLINSESVSGEKKVAPRNFSRGQGRLNDNNQQS